MKKNVDNFDNKLRYKLYRTIPEIVHPSISKKNISNYKIVLADNFIPVRVFYPEMVSNIDSVVIYIHGENSIPKKGHGYGDISGLFAKELKSLIISIDYDDTGTVKKMAKNIFPTCQYIIEEFNKLNIRNISLCGDSIGSNIVLELCKELKNNDLKLVLFYPQILSKAKVKKNIFDPNIPSLIILGSADINHTELVNMYNSIKQNDFHKLLELEFQPHAFLNNISEEEKKIIFETIDNFIR